MSIDPFRVAPGGVYREGELTVLRGRGGAWVGPAADFAALVHTEHFDLWLHEGQMTVAHGLDAGSIDNDLTGLLADELFSPGWLRGQEMMERIFTGVVLSIDEDPLQAWEYFYRNTLRGIDECLAPDFDPATRHNSTIAEYAPIYAKARELIVGQSVLDVGSCFGFGALRLAQDGFDVHAVDLNPGSMRLLKAMAQRIAPKLRATVGDMLQLPAEVEPCDTVLALHVLEHLDEQAGEQALKQLLAVTRQRLVVAVPLEENPDPRYGHVRAITLSDLDRWGAAMPGHRKVFEHHGGWLVANEAESPAMILARSLSE